MADGFVDFKDLIFLLVLVGKVGNTDLNATDNEKEWG